MSMPSTTLINAHTFRKHLKDILTPSVFLILVLGPVIVLVFKAAESILGVESQWLTLILPQDRRLILILRSVGLAAGVGCSGLILGIVGATLLLRFRDGPLSILRWFLLLLVPIPPYLHALGWSAFFLKLNAVLSAGGLPVIAFRGWFAAWWVQLMALLPISIGTALIGLESIDSNLIDAARMAREDYDVLKSIVLPLSAPILLTGGAIQFLLSLIDYSVPSLFQVTTYALDIFADFSASNDPGRAFLLSVPLLIITFSLIFLLQSPLRNVALRPPWKSRIWESPPRWPNWLVTLHWLAALLFLIQILVPLISQISLTGSISGLADTIRAAGDEISSTTWIALIASALSIPAAIPIAQNLLTKSSRWWFLVTLPLAIPSPLIGIGLITIWNRTATVGVYGSIAMPIMAAMARFAPLAVLVLLTQLRRTDSALIDAARVLQRSDLHSWQKVRIPLLLPGLLGTMGILSVLTAGELGATLMVAPPGVTTMTMRIYSFLHYGASEAVAGLGLVMSLAALALGSLVLFSFLHWSRNTSRENS